MQAINYKQYLIMAVVFLIGFTMVTFATRKLWLNLRDDAAAREEYAYLRELNVDLAAMITPPLNQVPQQYEQSIQNAESVAENQLQIAPNPVMDTLSVLSEINPDFIGWITIPGLAIDYPVVRGADNARYLQTTFSGEENSAGAIFMDYRCVEDFNMPVCLVYGHNMRDGSMFSPLTGFLDLGFMEKHPEINILTVNGEKRVYRIVEARITDAWDSIYTIDFNDALVAAENFATTNDDRILVLSTCTSRMNRSDLLLIFAVLVK